MCQQDLELQLIMDIKTGVKLIRLLQVQFASVAIVFGSANNSCTCKLHLKKFY